MVIRLLLFLVRTLEKQEQLSVSTEKWTKFSLKESTLSWREWEVAHKMKLKVQFTRKLSLFMFLMCPWSILKLANQLVLDLVSFRMAKKLEFQLNLEASLRNHLITAGSKKSVTKIKSMEYLILQLRRYFKWPTKVKISMQSREISKSTLLKKNARKNFWSSKNEEIEIALLFST